MIEILNRLIDEIESHLGDEPDVDALAAASGTTGYHLRRMFSSLAGMPVSEYVRRRRTASPTATSAVTAAPFAASHSSGSA